MTKIIILYGFLIFYRCLKVIFFTQFILIITKRRIMNKYTKLGVSALCGSLAAVSTANAGELAVSGGVDMSWISLPKAETGNPIGIGSNYTLSGSGELDNGWNVALSIAATNKMVYSTTNITVTVPSMGDLIITAGGTGKGIDRMDDVTPNVWEEAYGTGLSNGIQTVNGSTTGAGIEWTPNMMPDGLTARLFWTPDVTGAAASEKAGSGSAVNSGSGGYDVTLVADDSITGMAGLTVGAGYATFDQEQDGLVVTDYKSGKAPKDRYMGNKLHQVLLYAAALEALNGDRPQRARLFFLNNRNTENQQNRRIVEVDVNDKTLSQTTKKLQRTWQDLNRACEDETFPTKPQILCKWCSFLPNCSEGKQWVSTRKY